MNPEPGRPVLIAGPTASGKSALALAMAARCNGVIINTDSMQVYRDLRVLTARPSACDERSAPHRLYGHVDAADAYSAGRFAADAKQALESACTAGQTPIFVGGTGLYFQVLDTGLSPVPQIPADIRTHWRAEADRLGGGGLHAVLSEQDPVMAARLVPSDRQRIVRALEVKHATGQSLAVWQQQPGEPVLPRQPDPLRILVIRDRSELHSRSDARFSTMMESGALDEVEALMQRKLDPGLPAMRALGVRPIAEYLAGRLTRGAAIEAGQAETRQYIKRQLTWSRRNMISFARINFSEKSIQEALSLL